MAQTSSTNPIDALMDRASAALRETDYFQALGLCERALVKARRGNDFERLARIALPLQEIHRQIRQMAEDTQRVFLISDASQAPETLEPGCYVVQPPLIGLDARTLSELGCRRGTPVIALAREPLTRDGRWPIVAVSEVSVRTRIAPPIPLERVESRVTRDDFSGDIPLPWFVAAYEALGDAAIATVDPAEPAAWRVDDLLERLHALPFHEKLHQALEHTARQAMHEPLPELPRRRPQIVDPFSF